MIRKAFCSRSILVVMGAVVIAGAAAASAPSLGTATTWVVTSPLGNSLRTNGEWRNERAIAALKSDGTVVTWGENPSNAPSASTLTNVDRIFSAGLGFAVIKNDGSVDSWGGAAGNFPNEARQAFLAVPAVRLFSTKSSFAGLRSDGSVIAWGSAGAFDFSGSPTEVALSSGVKTVSSTGSAFAALKTNGTVVAWGSAANGGDSSAVAGSLTSVKSISSTEFAFAAIKNDGSVVTWGDSAKGGDSSAVSAHLSGGVTNVVGTLTAFAALKADGSVVTWGQAAEGGDSTAVAGSLADGVVRVYANKTAFAALKADGSVIAWGSNGGPGAIVGSGATSVSGADAAFAVLRNDGSVVTWGNGVLGGDSSSVSSDLQSGVVEIIGSAESFAARKTNGSVITWGRLEPTPVTNPPAGLSSGVTRVFANAYAMTALKSNGSLLSWGSNYYGGDSSSKSADLAADVVTVASPIVVPARVPDPPTGVIAGAPSNQSTSLTFTAPADDGGLAITEYTGTCTSSNGGTTRSAAGSASGVTVTQLSKGKAYTCAVVARNGEGDSAPSDASTSITVPTTVPSAPLTASAASPSGRSVTVSFSAPADDGGVAVTRFDVACTSSNGGATRTATGPSSPLTVGDLTPGATYSCSVTATNAGGASVPAATDAFIVEPVVVAPPGGSGSPAAPAQFEGTASPAPANAPGTVPPSRTGAVTGPRPGVALGPVGIPLGARDLIKAAQRRVPKGSRVVLAKTQRNADLRVRNGLVTAIRPGTFVVRLIVRPPGRKARLVRIQLVAG